ncbi:hypothetical protein SAMN04488503_2271 [Humidesulfovibrio mexicanus]|uniref:Uncharacterized protein n=1 Tax=Humidesulfovibrio mexicanus TaxID=147047 RepID=A0A239AWS8_9BACT|nr:hypothetical protein [Humidesulfovibrio mexicanus]SNS00010.1 hypothetical protein SAMN04488503_2271 [Humidesulfovibrio mexicanus]
MGFFDDDDTTRVDGVFQCESGKAVCVKVDGEDVWIPKSVCDDAWKGLDRGDGVTLEVDTWFAEKEGL